VPFVLGSENVFADLGLPNADELLIKADLAIAINGAIRKNGWSQAEVVERTGLTQPEVSKLGKMKTSGFSQERLQNVLRHLGMDVEIHVHDRADDGVGTIKVLKFA